MNWKRRPPKPLEIHIHYVWRQYVSAVRRGDQAGGLGWIKLLNQQLDLFDRAWAMERRKHKRKSIRRNRKPDGARKSPGVNRRAQRAAQAKRKPAAHAAPGKARNRSKHPPAGRR